jgi:hypothetical protein
LYGIDKYANGVYRVVRNLTEERFVFPVEFVSFDAATQYVTFKTKAPSESIAKLKAMKPGEWITATSPHGRRVENQPILSARPFGEPETTAGNSN